MNHFEQDITHKEAYRPKNIVIFSLLLVALVTLAFSIVQSYLVQKSFLATLASTVLLLTPFFLIGAILKYVDEAYDENRFPKPMAVFATAIGLLLMLGLSLTSYLSATLFLALIVSVSIAGKTAGTPFVAASGGYIILVFLLDIYLTIDPILFTIIIIVLTADEICAEFAKKALKRDDFKIKAPRWQRNSVFFLRDRNLGSLTLLVLAMIGWIPFVYWLAWILLDFGYIIVEGISHRQNLKKILLREVFADS